MTQYFGKDLMPHMPARAIQRLNSTSRRLRNVSGAIDLASIMVGVLVIGAISIVVSVITFSVIPWAQNSAAEAEVRAVSTAQAVAHVKDGSFLDSATLVELEYLPTSKSTATSPSADGQCYVTVSRSGSGNVYYGTNASPEVRELVGTPALDCIPLTGLPDLIEEVGGQDEAPAASPTITTSAMDIGSAGKPYTFAMKGAGGHLTWSATGLPDEFTIDESSGIIAGSPTNPYFEDVYVTATNATGSATATFQLIIEDNRPRFITGAWALPKMTSGVLYSATIQAAPGSVFTMTDTSAELGDLSITEAGVLSGTIDASASNWGYHDATVTITNENGSRTGIFYIGVLPVAPDLSTAPSTLNLVAGTYMTVILESFNTSPHSADYSTLAGSLPAGLELTFSGLIRGTPTAPGETTVTIRAVNGDVPFDKVIRFIVQP